MYELIEVGQRTYYIDCPAKIGIFKLNENDVALIDSGNDKSAAKKIMKHLVANEWQLKMIINTHSHADHIGGNKFLQDKTGCKIFAPGIDKAFVENPILEPSYLYGGYPCKVLRNKFLVAQESEVYELSEEILPEGLDIRSIDGHSFSQVAVRTSDDVWFMADCLTSQMIIEKYHVSFLYDVEAYLKSLEDIKTWKGELFIPAHADPCKDVSDLADVNIAKAGEIIDLLMETCRNGAYMDDVLKAVFDKYGLKMDMNQYVLVGGTIRSYLSYLYDRGQMNMEFVDNKLVWKTE